MDRALAPREFTRPRVAFNSSHFQFERFPYLTHTRITVAGGRFTVTISSRDALAVHIAALGTGSGTGGGSTPPTSGTVSVTFAETATTTFGEVSLQRQPGAHGW